MKISFSGSASVGKSTLAQFISTELNVPYIPEFARELIEDENKYTWKSVQTDLEEFIKFQTDIISLKNEEEGKHRSFVSDRTFIDSLVFVEFRFAREHYLTLQEETPYPEYKTYLDFYDGYKKFCMSKDLSARYDIVFYVEPFSEDVVDDGLRNVNKIYNRLVGKNIYSELMASPMGEKVVVVNQMTLEDRKRFVLNTIKNLQ